MQLEQMLKEIEAVNPSWYFVFDGAEWRAQYRDQLFYFTRTTLEDIVRAVYLATFYPEKYQVSDLSTYVYPTIEQYEQEKDNQYLIAITFPILKERALHV